MILNYLLFYNSDLIINCFCIKKNTISIQWLNILKLLKCKLISGIINCYII